MCTSRRLNKSFQFSWLLKYAWYVSKSFLTIAAWWWRICSSWVRLWAPSELDVNMAKKLGEAGGLAFTRQLQKGLPNFFGSFWYGPCKITENPDLGLLANLPAATDICALNSLAASSILGLQAAHIYSHMMLCYNWHLPSADMLPFTIQGGIPERKWCSSDTCNDKFKEMVRTSKLIPFLLPWVNAYRCTLPSRGGLSFSVSQNQTLSKARGKP